MSKLNRWSPYVLTALLLAGCSGGGSSGQGGVAPGVTPKATPQTGVTLTAGLEALTPETQDTISPSVDLQRLGIMNVDTVYEFTSPADAPFAFNVFAREEGNAGAVTISLGHLADGGVAPSGDVTSIVEAGIVPSGSGSATNGDWLEIAGDGFARLSIRGRITRDQVLALRAENRAGARTTLVRIRVGAASEIAVETGVESPYPGVVSQKTLYSSDSFQFGLPTVAISGNRTSVLFYEGDDNDPRSPSRYEMRLQADSVTGAVTGGGSSEASPDSGNWRDHEIAALFNVLAKVRGGDADVSLSLSFDRGASFAQTQVLETGSAANRLRLVQIAMADDYTIGIIYWRTAADYDGELMLVEGRPSAFDATGSPTAFAFDPPVLVHDAATDVTPLVMGMQYSAGGDLVIGYGYSRSVQPTGGGMFASLTTFRCAVQLFGSSTFNDTLVDEEYMESFDPSISLVGQGTSLGIFYAYESTDGVKMKISSDAGATFSGALKIGDGTAFQPSVFVRQQAGLTRLDVLFVEQRNMGPELRVMHWDHYDGVAAGKEYTLAESSTVPVPGGQGQLQVTALAWMGYDAVLDGDDVVVVYDEHTYDAYMFCGGPPMGLPTGGIIAAQAAAPFAAATPPPLAPGMTQPLPAPDPSDQHQLKCLRLD